MVLTACGVCQALVGSGMRCPVPLLVAFATNTAGCKDRARGASAHCCCKPARLACAAASAGADGSAALRGLGSASSANPTCPGSSAPQPQLVSALLPSALGLCRTFCRLFGRRSSARGCCEMMSTWCLSPRQQRPRALRTALTCRNTLSSGSVELAATAAPSPACAAPLTCFVGDVTSSSLEGGRGGCWRGGCAAAGAAASSESEDRTMTMSASMGTRSAAAFGATAVAALLSRSAIGVPAAAAPFVAASCRRTTSHYSTAETRDGS